MHLNWIFFFGFSIACSVFNFSDVCTVSSQRLTLLEDKKNWEWSPGWEGGVENWLQSHHDYHYPSATWARLPRGRANIATWRGWGTRGCGGRHIQHQPCHERASQPPVGSPTWISLEDPRTGSAREGPNPWIQEPGGNFPLGSWPFWHSWKWFSGVGHTHVQKAAQTTPPAHWHSGFDRSLHNIGVHTLLHVLSPWGLGGTNGDYVWYIAGRPDVLLHHITICLCGDGERNAFDQGPDFSPSLCVDML